MNTTATTATATPATAATPAAALTVSEAATVLGVSVRTVRRWIATGQLPATRRGPEWRIAVAALGHRGHDGQGPAAAAVGHGHDRAATAVGHDGHDGRRLPVPQQAEALAAVLVAPLVALVERQQAELVDQAVELERRAGELEHLRARVAELERDVSPMGESTPPRPWYARLAFWRRARTLLPFA